MLMAAWFTSMPIPVLHFAPRASAARRKGVKTGFDSPKYFCKVFKEATGLSPREFRTSFLNNDLK